MDLTLTTELPTDFDPSPSMWVRYEGGPGADRAIDYSIAVVEADPGTGRVDFLVRWEPDAFCHRHRHLGETMAAVLVGEQHVIEHGPFETITKVRSAGFVGPVPDGETHWERGGSDGLTMLFSTHAPDGRLFEMVDDAGQVLATATIADFLERQSEVAAATG